jgi:hypothetical protein
MKRWVMIGILVILVFSLFYLYSNTNADLHETKARLNLTQTSLDSTRMELALQKAELKSTRAELESAKATLLAKEATLRSTRAELDSVKTKLASTLASLSAREAELETVKEKLAEREIELADLQVSYQGLMTGHGYTIRDPTYRELVRFLKADDTDKAKYIEGKYECTEFAADLCNRAEEEGIRCAYVILSFPNGMGHAIVAFNTIDEGLVYVEPQHDEFVKVELGKRFYQCIVPRPGYYYEEPSYDDTIEQVLVIW